MERYTTCQMCGSKRIIPNASVQDDVVAYASPEHRITVRSKPEAFLLKGAVSGALRAYICGDCGYAVLFTSNAAALYEAYLQSRTGRKG